MKKWFSASLSAAAAILFFSFCSAAQDFEATVKIVAPLSGKVRVEGRFLNENILRSPENWAFARSLAGREDLGERISALDLTDKNGQKIAFRKLIAGEYLAEQQTAQFSYEIELHPTEQFTAMAHISWLSGERGILMTGDLFPQLAREDGKPVSARIKFELPAGWQVFGSENSSAENDFEVADVEKAVFPVGRDWREKNVPVKDFALKLTIAGEWLFSDDEAAAFAGQIFEDYQKMLGGLPGKKAQIILVPLDNKKGRWEAETRGRTVTVISGDMNFKKPSLQRLHEQLRHELFHLWMPNDLVLDGNYDWFYEGFTVYQSLRTGLKMNRISFDDFLATLSESYNSANFQDQQTSLVAASNMRRSGQNPQVYARGMVVAFMSDAAILQKSKGKHSIEDIFRQVYAAYRLPNQKQEGNIAVLRILKSRAELRPVIEKYIEGAENINLTAALESLGIEANKLDFGVQLRVKDKLNGRQKDLLDKLGYNNWRKISGKSK